MSRKGKTGTPAHGYEIGYGRPPTATQFRPGKSGNPHGRPRPQPSLAARLQTELNRRVRVEERGRTKTMTVAEVIIRRVVQDAARAEPRAVRTLFQLMEKAAPKEPPSTLAPEVQEQDHAILERYLKSVGGPGEVCSPRSLDSEDCELREVAGLAKNSRAND